MPGAVAEGAVLGALPARVPGSIPRGCGEVEALEALEELEEWLLEVELEELREELEEVE